MSDVRLVVRDVTCDWSGTIHGSMADRAIAALSADPVTKAELEVAMTRFAKPTPNGSLLAGLSPGLCDEPVDAGLVVIDLAALLVVVDSTYSAPNLNGYVTYHNGHCATDKWLRFHLSHDWLMLGKRNTWRSVAQERRGQRLDSAPRDHREVLYGFPLLQFVAGEVFAAFGRREAVADSTRARLIQQARDPQENLGPKLDPAELQRLTDEEILRKSWPNFDRTSSPLYGILKEIHADWLLTPRADLGGLCPREVALDQQDHISWDLQDRGEQWTTMRECPPGLDESSFAYRHGGFGTHELVMYYDLVRGLIWSCWSHLEELTIASRTTSRPAPRTAGEFVGLEVPCLEKVREAWFDTPDPEHHMRTPRSIIHRERARIPEAISPHEAVVDPDCPCCQMLADMPGPVFWGLDGCNMDDDFAFDIQHRTYEEWEEEQRKWDEFNKRFDAEQMERKNPSLSNSATSDADVPSVWSSSFSSGETTGVPLSVRVFGIGCHLSEVIADLRGEPACQETPPEIRRTIEQLNRDFGNFREILVHDATGSSGETLLHPVIDRFSDTLADVARAHPEISLKCEALASELNSFLDHEPPESDVPLDLE